MLTLFFVVTLLAHSQLPPVTETVAVGDEKPAAAATIAPGTSRAWALATCAVVFERNGQRHDLLGGVEVSEKSRTDAEALLADSWDIKETDHLLQQLEWLQHSGHRADFEKSFKEIGKLSEKEIDAKAAKLADSESQTALKALWRNAPKAAKLKGGLLGWDLCRYVALCRWGYAAGYLSEEDAWKRMDSVIKDIQKAYASWEELGEAYCIGYDCWRPGKGEDTVKAFEKLKTSDTSPWKATPWKQKLVSLEKPEKPADSKKKP